MNRPINHQVRLAARPVGEPKRSDWNFTEEPVRTLDQGEVLVRVTYVSLDPAMRGWMNEGRSYIAGVRIGDVMRAGTIGHVLESRDPEFKVGATVIGMHGVQEYGISKGSSLMKADPSLAPEPVLLGGLGGPGLTAYFGLLDVGRPKAGDTVLVSAAAGAVGSVAGQIAKIAGCRAVGIAGGPAKCKYIVDELGYDAAIDYKNEDVAEALKKKCVNGVDVYFDNVGGDVLDAALMRLNMRARVVICGAISQYNSTEGARGPANYLALLTKRARMEGFILLDYKERYAEGTSQLATWYKGGKLKFKNQVIDGLDKFPEALLRLFTGDKLGKLLLKIG